MFLWFGIVIAGRKAVHQVAGWRHVERAHFTNLLMNLQIKMSFWVVRAMMIVNFGSKAVHLLSTNENY